MLVSNVQLPADNIISVSSYLLKLLHKQLGSICNTATAQAATTGCHLPQPATVYHNFPRAEHLWELANICHVHKRVTVMSVMLCVICDCTLMCVLVTQANRWGTFAHEADHFCMEGDDRGMFPQLVDCPSIKGPLDPKNISQRYLKLRPPMSLPSWSLLFSGVMLTAAMFLRPCQAAQTSSCVDLCFTLFLYCRFNGRTGMNHYMPINILPVNNWDDSAHAAHIIFYKNLKKRYSFLINQRVLV